MNAQALPVIKAGNPPRPQRREPQERPEKVMIGFFDTPETDQLITLVANQHDGGNRSKTLRRLIRLGLAVNEIKSSFKDRSTKEHPLVVIETLMLRTTQLALTDGDIDEDESNHITDIIADALSLVRKRTA